MKKINCAKGTPEQLRDAVIRQINSLGGDDVIESASYFDPGAVAGLDDMTIGEMTRFLYEYWQSMTDDPEAIDYYGYEKHLTECYQSEKGDSFTGSYDDYLREKCDEAIADGFELTDEFLNNVNDPRQEVANCNDISTTDTIESTTSVAEVLDFLSSKGYDVESEEVKNYAEGVASYMDISEEAYKNEDLEWPYTLDQWYKDTMQNYPDDLVELPRVVESATNSVNVACATNELTPAQVDDLWSIADSFVTSNPVSGDWDTETAAEQQYIADHFDCSLEQAKQYMINYLGFEPTDSFIEASADIDADVDPDEAANNTYDVVEAADEFDDEDTDNGVDHEYIDKVGDQIDKAVQEQSFTVGPDNDYVDSVLIDDTDPDGENLFITVTYNHDGESIVEEFDLPFDDLQWNDIDEDAGYIQSEIIAALAEE